MSDYLIQQETMKGIANQIRRISNTSDSYTALEILEILSRIQGSIVTPNGSLVIQVVDYDGTILKTENLNKDNVFILPEPPIHDGLIFDGWVAPTPMIGGFVTASVIGMTIGASYTTASGATEIYITTSTNNEIVEIPQMIKATSIDWGDGTIVTENISYTHTYSSAGNYVIKIFNAIAMTRSTTSPNSYITEIRMSNTIKQLGNRCFYSSTNLTKILFSKNIETMGYANFNKCTSLEYVVLPKKLKENNCGLHAYNFENCTALKSIILPNELEELEYYMFYNTPLSNMILPNNLRDIKKCSICKLDNRNQYINMDLNYTIKDNIRFLPSFNNLYFALIDYTIKPSGEVTIPNDVEVIAYYAFRTNRSSSNADTFGANNTITKIILPESVKGISSHCCYYEESLTEVVMSSNVDTIGDYAFSNCISLITTLPTGLKKVGDEAFVGTKIKEANFTDSLIRLGNSVFKDCVNLESIRIPSTLIFNNYPYYENYKKWENLNSLCKGCTSLKKAELLAVVSDKDSEIYEDAFDGCVSLEDVVLSNEFISIDSYMFRGCSSLPNLNFLSDSKIKYIKTNAFNGCSSLTDIVLPDTVIEIEADAFANCSGLTKFNLPKNVRIFDNNPISGCNNITELTSDNNQFNVIGNGLVNNKKLVSAINSTIIPSDGSVTQIGSNAFKGLTGLSKIIIPNTITYIESYAFKNSSVTEIEILGNVSELYHEVFCDCKNLEKIILPNSLRRIHTAFAGCTALKSIEIPNNVYYLSSRSFKDCVSLESVKLPDALKELGNSTFEGCTSLKSITIPDGVTYIGYECFKNCTSLETIYIPDSVTEISYDICEGCTSLVSVVYNGTEEQWANVSVSTNTDLLNVLTFTN